MMKFRLSSVLLFFAIILFGCSSTPPSQPKASEAAQPAVKPPTLYTAKQCFDSMLGLAQRWQADAMPFHVESEWNTEATGQEGKATVWRAFFASPSRRTMKTLTCSGSRLLGAPAAGFTDSPEAPYSPDVPSLIFQPFAFVVDSDKAYAVTLDHGGKALIEKDPNQAIVYSLDWDRKTKQLTWAVYYGKNAAPDVRKGLCVVDAKTGAFIAAGK